MNNKFALALLLTLLVTGCTKPEERFTVNDNVNLRLVAADDCGYCKVVDYSPDGKDKVKIKLRSLVVRAQDIDYVVRSYEIGREIKFFYKPSAHSRILEATRNNVGAVMVVMAGDQAVSLSQISGPFSEGSEIGGITPAEADYMISQIADKPYIRNVR